MKKLLLIVTLAAGCIDAEPLTTTPEHCAHVECPAGFYVAEGPHEHVCGCYQKQDGGSLD